MSLTKEERRNYNSFADSHPGVDTVCRGFIPGVGRIEDLDDVWVNLQRADPQLMMDGTCYGWSHVVGTPLTRWEEFALRLDDRIRFLKHPRKELWAVPRQSIFAIANKRESDFYGFDHLRPPAYGFGDTPRKRGAYVLAHHTWCTENNFRVADLFNGINPQKVEYLIRAVVYEWRKSADHEPEETSLKLTIFERPKLDNNALEDFGALLRRCSFEDHVTIIAVAGRYPLGLVTEIPLFRQAAQPLQQVFYELSQCPTLAELGSSVQMAGEFGAKKLYGQFGAVEVTTEFGQSLGIIGHPSEPYVSLELRNGEQFQRFYFGFYSQKLVLHDMRATVSGARSLVNELIKTCPPGFRWQGRLKQVEKQPPVKKQF